MRRAVAWGCALVSILALAACGFARWPLSAAKVGDSLNAAFGALPRLHWSAPQAATFSVLPWPSVHIVDARLDDIGGVNLLSAPTARLDLSLVELARGRFIPTRADPRQPDRDPGHRPPAVRRGGRTGCAGERRRRARAVDEPEPVKWPLARRRREARPRHADRQRPGPPRRTHGRQSTALQPLGGMAQRADRDRRGPERSRGGGEGRIEPVRIRARFPDREIRLRRRGRARGKAGRRGRHDRLRPLDRGARGSLQRRAPALPRRRRHRRLG